MSYIFGLRFDVSAVIYTNLLVILLSILPFSFVAKRWYGFIVGTFYVVSNAFAFAANLIDVAYFPFSQKRATFDIFDFVAGVPNMNDLWATFLTDYWYLFAILLILIALLIVTAIFTRVKYVPDFYKSAKNIFIYIGVRLLLVAAAVIGIRGGLQLKPISNATAAAYEGGNNTAMILNTPFSIIRTYGKSELVAKSYFASEEDASMYFTPIKCSSVNNMLNLPPTNNVVIIILEGISSEYSEFLACPPKTIAGYTPFLDSLARNSMVFKGYANGLQSITALPSILGSVPSLSETPFSNSQYITNKIDYPVKMLANSGYYTAFFHGAENGTMGFANMCKIMNVQDYFGLNEYPNKDDYDGSWGIPDYQYLQYVADKLDDIDGKIVASVFTLSSHHPFVVPADYDEVVISGDFPMQHTVAYTDMALQKFFDKVSEMDWFDNTLFVITADHTNFNGWDKIDYLRLYDIPMIFYHPKADSSFVSEKIMQQIDIMPSVISYLGENKPFVAFGNNVFDTTQQRFAVTHANDFYQFCLNGKRIRLHSNDELEVVLSQDDKNVSEYEENFIKSFVQQYNNGLINNSLFVK